jgi:hypothetical protein
MVYATGPYKTKHTEVGYAHYTTVILFLTLSLILRPGRRSAGRGDVVVYGMVYATGTYRK